MSASTNRVDDVIDNLSLAERAGLLFHPMIIVTDGFDLETRPPWGGPSARELIADHSIRFICIGGPATPAQVRDATSQMQELAITVGPRLPIVFSTDPRHSFVQNDAASHAAVDLSQWPEPIGFGALADPDAVREFADTVRSDYRTMGIRMALHPQVDLATEPRWARQAQSFAADHHLTSALVRAYIAGLQEPALGTEGVAATTKHFPGGGPQLDGEDPHFPYGREQVYPGGRFAEHLAPFRAAIEAGTAAIMPYYGMPVGLDINGKAIESVGFAFNRAIITELLRDELGFTGVVLSDFGLITDQQVFGKPFPARAWGVEGLDGDGRMARLFDAGVDQLGGEQDVPRLLRLVEEGRIDAGRITESARRLVALQERLGMLQEGGHLPSEAARATREQVELGLRMQSRVMAILSNSEVGDSPLLPLAGGTRMHLVGFGIEATERHSVAEIDAEVVVVRIASPFEPRDDYFLESGMQQGSLDLADSDVSTIIELAKRRPTVLVVTLTRPAILTPVADAVSALVVDFGASDEAVLATLQGRVAAEGVLPFELPRSMEAVKQSLPDVASDTVSPLFAVGSGIRLPDSSPHNLETS